MNKRIRLSISPGDLRAGSVFLPPGRILVAETVPLVSEPPGNSSELQAHAGFFLRIEKPQWFFNMHHRPAACGPQGGDA
jgi:hypothetical protein